MAYSSIVKPTDYFRTKLYTGNGSNDRAITFDESTNMQPDWLWIKSRGTGQSHAIFDAVRGANKRLVTNSSGAETTENTNLDSFDTNGFTIDNEAIVNENGIGYVAWNWLAGGSASSNSNGSITSSVSANTTAGFSIVSYTGNSTAGATVGHSLGVKPSMIIIKNRSDGQNWCVYHSSIGATKYLQLNTTSAEIDTTVTFNDTEPTSSVFTLSDGAGHRIANFSGDNYVAYCFAEKTGYSKFGSYTGNGNADGTFVYTGFKPAFLIVKVTNESGFNWVMYDNKRDTFNTVGQLLKPSSNAAELDNSNIIDFLSNGIKMRNNSIGTNGSADTYIYMAIGQSLVGSNNVPCTAR
jgi:hypothetical protein